MIGGRSLSLDECVGKDVRAFGSTTGKSTGTVTNIENVEVDYGSTVGIKNIHTQLRVEGDGFVQGGDSGSPVFDSDGNFVGIVFAKQNDNVGYVTPVEAIESSLPVKYLSHDDVRDVIETFDINGDGQHNTLDVVAEYDRNHPDDLNHDGENNVLDTVWLQDNIKDLERHRKQLCK
jgi:S1-C subfamily serine protease